MSRARNWCFTLNNFTGQLCFDDTDVTYAIWQHELSETGTPHYQGYIELSKPYRLAALKNIPGLERAHFDPRKGTRDQARKYCTPCKKGPEGSVDPTYVDGPWEHGDFGEKKPGQRNDIVRLYESVKEGKSNKQLLEESPASYMRYYKAVAHVRHVIAPKREFKTEVYVVWGDTGLGKSFFAKENTENAYWKQRGDWWDEYDGSSDVIIDDFYGWIKWDTLLRLTDENPCQVEIKGGHVNFAPKRIIFTSNAWPNKWYTNEHIKFETFARRVTKWIYFTGYKTYLQADTWDGLQRLAFA